MSQIRTDNYTLLLQKLDAFIRKYYLNQLLRGVLYATAVVVGLFTLINLGEYVFYFSTALRKLLFYGFLATSIGALVLWVFVPLAQYFRLGKLISHAQAATIIGSHFTNIKDKLLNILQLREQHYYNTENAALIEASIKQKSAELRPVPFQAAIDLSNNSKYLKYALPPLALLLGILAYSPNIIRDSTARLVDNNTVYEKPAPFTFAVSNQNLNVVQYEDYKLEVNVAGTTLPSDVFIDVDGFQYKLNKDANDKFSYTFPKVNDNAKFRLTANGYNSKGFELNVLKKPVIQGLQVALDYPAYTGRKDEQLENVGDLIVPAGTNITWALKAANANAMDVRYNWGKPAPANMLTPETFAFGAKAMNDLRYTLFLSNPSLHHADSVSYAITVQQDAHPAINVQQFKDTAVSVAKVLYFAGDASDDYGISRLTVNYKIEGEKRNLPMQSLTLKGNSGTATQFEYTLDVNKLSLLPGDKVTYFFEVFDNDAVHGAKSAKSGTMVYEMPSKAEYQKMENQNNEEIKQDLSAAISEAQQIQEDIKKITDKFLQKKELTFQDKKELERLMEKQKELEKKMEEAKKNMQENMQNQQDFKSTDKKLAEKQQQLQELFDKLNNPELKKLMEDMQKMMDEMKKDQALDKLDDMKISNEELEKELDRLKELFKQMELEQKLNEAIDKLEDLAKKEEDLAKKSDEGKEKSDDLKKEQDKLNKEFKDAEKKMEEIDKKNAEMEKPEKLEDTKEDQKETEEEMEKSSDDLEKNDKKGASKKQKSAAAKMKKMAQKMKNAMQQSKEEQNEEDLKAMRQLLENLVTVSFSQEKTMEEIVATSPVAPKYVDLVQTQFKVKDDFKVIEDSLQALAKRQFKIKSFITEKVTEIKSAMGKGIEFLEDRQKGPAQVQQQKTMTGLNDLALMLSESMDDMQQSMAEGKPGAMCKKPGKGKGKGKGNKPGLGEMQRQLGDQMKKMGEQMKEGGGKPGSKPGGKAGGSGQGGQGGKDGMSKQFAEAAAKQAAIRKALKEMQEDRQQKGQGADKGLQDLMQEMDKNEEQLVNKQLTNEMQKRQQEIMGKLLEAEKAERERGEDETREAQQPRAYTPPVPPVALQEYLKKRQSEVELYRTTSPALRPYYRSLVENYYNTLRAK
jgi:hypothetical protein